MAQQFARRRLEQAMLAFRKRRMEEFASAFRIAEDTTILDLGGTPWNWRLLQVHPRVTLLNMPRAQERLEPGFEFVAANGCYLPFRDRSFSIVFSNSVIEHVGSAADQARLASEIRRVGERYWVQTPNRGFPVEPHLLTPFLHFLPRRWQGPLARRWTFWDAIEHPSPDRRAFYIEHYLKDICLLRASDMTAMFPDGRLIRERFLGITKSLVVARF